MTTHREIPPAGLFIDIGQGSLKAVNDGDFFEFPLERGENGRLTDLCRERLTAGLRGFIGKKPGAANRTAWCAVGARGVSMRRMSLPSASRDEFQRVLRLQIEGEFPLSPDELAWGWRPVGTKAAENGNPARQDVLVVAVKKDLLREYADILNGCGTHPQFTLAALARAELQPAPAGRCAVLDIGRTHSELMTFSDGIPNSIRILPWGGDNITRAIAQKLGIGHDDAEKLKLTLNQPNVAFGPQGLLLQNAVESALAILTDSIRPALENNKLVLTGKSARDPSLAPTLAALLGSGAVCESLEKNSEGPLALSPGSAAKPAAIAGLMKCAAGNGSPLILELNGGQSVVKAAPSAIWKWAAAAVALAIAVLVFPYAEALVMKPVVEKRLAALKADRGRLKTIDAELAFLKFVQQTNLPCLDVVYLLAKISPQGAHLDGLSLGQHQPVGIRMKLNSVDQVTEFCAKMIESGWFTNVIVEEQTPAGQGGMMGGGGPVNIRMTADLNPNELRKALPRDPADKKGVKTPPVYVEPMVAMPPPEAPAVAPAAAPASPPVAMPAAMPDAQDSSAGPRRGRGRRAGAMNPDL